MARYPAAAILGFACDLPAEQVEQVGAIFDEPEAAQMSARPDWLKDVPRENALWFAAPDVVLAAVEDQWIGSPECHTLIEKMTRHGLLRDGTLDAILRALGDR